MPRFKNDKGEIAGVTPKPVKKVPGRPRRDAMPPPVPTPVPPPPPTVADYDRLIREHAQLKERHQELLDKNTQLTRDLTVARIDLRSATERLVGEKTCYDTGYQTGRQDGFGKGIYRIVAAAEAKMCEEFKCKPSELASKKPAWWIAALVVTNPTIPDPGPRKSSEEHIKISSGARGLRP